MSNIDPRALREAFGRFMTGVTIVTTQTPEGVPVGFTANSFTSVSLDPPLLLVCPGRFLSCFDAVVGCQTFAVSILAEGQEAISNVFAGFKGDRFAEVKTHLDAHGVPLIEGAVATFSCTTHQVVDAGDHAILIGQVMAFTSVDRPGLGYQGGQYFSLGLERAAHAADAKTTICGVIVSIGNGVVLERTAAGYQPLQRTLSNRHDMVQSLSQLLSKQGLTADIGPVYSVFDDAKTGTHYAYVLATAHTTEDFAALRSGADLEIVPVSRLTMLAFASAALTDMMHRFATEAQSGDFTLYLGDTEHGETHKQTDRR